MLKRGKLSERKPASLPGGGEIQKLEEDDYKYLGILEAYNIKHNHLKTKIKYVYLRRLKVKVKAELGKHDLGYQYMCSVLESIWSRSYRTAKDELKQINRKTRKLITMYRCLHPNTEKSHFKLESL